MHGLDVLKLLAEWFYATSNIMYICKFAADSSELIFVARQT